MSLYTLDEVREKNNIRALSDKEIVGIIKDTHFPDKSFAEVGKMFGYQRDTDITTPVRAFAGEVEQAIPSLVGGVSTLLKATAFEGTNTELLSKAQEWAKEYQPTFELSDKEREKFWSAMVPSGFGSAIKYMSYAVATKGWSLPVMAVDIFGRTFNDISKTNPEWSEDKRVGYSALVSVPQALMTQWSTLQLLKPFKKIGTTTAREMIRGTDLFKNFSGQVIQGYAREFTEEMGQGLWGNAVAKLYGLDRKLWDGVLEGALVGGIVGGVMGGTGASIQNIFIKQHHDQFKALGFTDGEIDQIAKVLGDTLDQEIKTNPESVKQVLETISTIGESVRKTNSLRKDIKSKMMKADPDMTSQQADDLMSDMNLDKMMQMEGLIQQKETADTVRQYKENLSKLELQAIEAGVKPEVAHKSLKLHDIMVESFAKTQGVTKIDVLNNLVKEVVRGETYDQKKAEIESRVKEDVADVVAMPEVDRGVDFVLKNRIGQHLNKDVEINGQKGKLVQTSEGDLVVETLDGEVVDLSTQSLDVDVADIGGLKVKDVPVFRLSNFGNTMTYTEGGKPKRAEIKDIRLNEKGKLRMDIVSDGKKKTIRNHNFILDVDIARNKTMTREQYKSLPADAKARVDNQAKTLIIEQGVEQKGVEYIPFESIIQRFYTPETQGILEAIDKGEPVSKRNLVLTQEKVINMIEEVERRKLPKSDANKLLKIFYEQMEVIDNELRKQGDVDNVRQRETGESFETASKRIKQRASEIRAEEQIKANEKDMALLMNQDIDMWVKGERTVIQDIDGNLEFTGGKRKVADWIGRLLDISKDYNQAELRRITKKVIDGKELVKTEPDKWEAMVETWGGTERLDVEIQRLVQESLDFNKDQIARRTAFLEDLYILDNAYWLNETDINKIGQILDDIGIYFESNEYKNIYIEEVKRISNEMVNKYESLEKQAEEAEEFFRDMDIMPDLKLEPKTDDVMSAEKVAKQAKENYDKLYDKVDKEFNPQGLDETQRLFFLEDEQMSLFQEGSIVETEIKGSYLTAEKIVKIYETADDTTFIHELSHSWLHWYSQTSPKAIEGLMKWAKITNINNPVQYRTLQEKFADAFVDNYLYEGKSPIAELASTFESFRNWLIDVFKTAKRNEIRLPKEITQFFDTMLTEGFEAKTEIAKTGLTNMEFFQQERAELLQARKELKEKVIRAGKWHKGDVKASTKAEIKDIQTKLIGYIENIEGMETKEKGIFLRNIKNANSPKSLQRQIKRVTEKALSFVEAKQKREVGRLIDKQLRKPPLVKQGMRKIGKFDYETNKLMLALREMNKLTQDSAGLRLQAFQESLDGRLPTNYEKMQLRFLSYQSQGMRSSLEAMMQVLQDIEQAKELGKLAKDDAELEKKLNRHEEYVTLMDQLYKNKVERAGLTRAIEAGYAKGFGNIYSFLNAIFSKEIAEMYNMEIVEANKQTRINQQMKAVVAEAIKIFELKNKREYDKWIAETSKKEYKLTDRKNKTDDISKQQIMHIYLGLQNTNVRQAYNYYYNLGEADLVSNSLIEAEIPQQISSLLENLTESDIAYADMLQELIQRYYPDLNAVHIRETGLDLRVPENYFPMTSEHEVSFLDDIKRQGETISAQKERTSFAKPMPTNASTRAFKYINDAEHKINVSERYVELKKLFNSNEVVEVGGEGKTLKSLITDLYGENSFYTLNKLLDSLSLQEVSKATDMWSKAFGAVLDNWTIAKIALNPTVFAKQLISTGNYIENMPAGKWLAGFSEGLTNPMATWKYMMENIPYCEARFAHGYNKELQVLISQSEKKGGILGGHYVKFLTSFTRTGDMMAIVYGGYPYFKHLLSTGLTMEQAVDQFTEATVRSQQSPLMASLSEFQQYASKNPFTRAYTVFKNTPTQYFRKQIDATIQFSKGEVDMTQYAKTMAIYTLIQPALYAFAGLGAKAILYGDEFEEKWLDEMLMSLAISPFGAIPLFADVARAGYQRATGKKVWSLLNQGAYGDIERMGKILLKENITGEDFIKAMTIGTEITTKFPAGQVERLINKNKDRLGF